MRSLDDIAAEICTLAGRINAAHFHWLKLIAEFDERPGLCRFHHRAVHEGGIVIEMLDDGALRFVKPNGDAIDSVLPGCTQPFGDWRRLPVPTQLARYTGDEMDLDLAVDVLIQKTRRARNVPAGT